MTKCLRDICQIPGEFFFVAAEDNGKTVCFSTPGGGSKQLDCAQFFDNEAFIKEVARVQMGTSTSIITENT